MTYTWNGTDNEPWHGPARVFRHGKHCTVCQAVRRWFEQQLAERWPA